MDASTITTYQMLIDGQWVNSCASEWIDVEVRQEDDFCPCAARAAPPREPRAAAATDRHFPGLEEHFRREIVAGCFWADGLELNKEKLARLISLAENGNALRTQSRGEAELTANIMRYVAGLARELKGKSTYLSAETLDYTRREPYGVVGAVVLERTAARLPENRASHHRAGNTIVLKASEEAQLARPRVRADLQRTSAPRCCNVLTGTGLECGAPLVEHPNVPKVSFTGSTAVGRSILAAASNRIAAVTLELGGKSAQLCFPMWILISRLTVS